MDFDRDVLSALAEVEQLSKMVIQWMAYFCWLSVMEDLNGTVFLMEIRPFFPYLIPLALSVLKTIHFPMSQTCRQKRSLSLLVL